jgi:polar amino acid transport system substrate-binding protein
MRRVVLGWLLVAATSTLAYAQGGPAPFRWAGDPEGGAPYVEASPTDPNVVVGFDVDIANLIARGLGRSPSFVVVGFTSIDQSVARDDADIGLSGIEDTPARRAAMAVTVPYYQFSEVLSVRDADARRYVHLPDLAGRRVGTLGGTIAYEILLRAERTLGITPVSYDDDVHPYADLVMGRLDAVLLDNVLAVRRKNTTPGYTIQPDPVATSHYVGVMAPGRSQIRDQVNVILREAMRSGELEQILRKRRVWNDDQAPLYRQVLAGETIAPIVGFDAADNVSSMSWGRASIRYLPALLKASVTTLALSCASMMLAVALGILIASGRVYGNRVVRVVLTGYVELMRGTPVLLQLFVLYYGIAAAVRLPAFVAALLGLALNYAAYESEIYRSALEAVSTGQLEAARTLGFSERQVLTLIRGPQAFRLALAPMTNDFVALLKDSSLVSVLTVMELTKQTQIFATNLGSWVVPGTLCAALYLAMSLPLSSLARRLEHRWKAPTA